MADMDTVPATVEHADDATRIEKPPPVRAKLANPAFDSYTLCRRGLDRGHVAALALPPARPAHTAAVRDTPRADPRRLPGHIRADAFDRARVHLPRRLRDRDRDGLGVLPDELRRDGRRRARRAQGVMITSAL